LKTTGRPHVEGRQQLEVRGQNFEPSVPGNATNYIQASIITSPVAARPETHQTSMRERIPSDAHLPGPLFHTHFTAPKISVENKK
jgi:hypothetical protein